MALDLTNEVVIRWSDPDPKYAPLLKEGGITMAWGDAPGAFRDACAAAGVKTVAPGEIQSLKLDELSGAKPGTPVAVNNGMWPGVRGRDANVASATRSLWMDVNLYRPGYIRALYPRVPTVLGYLPDKDAGIEPDRVIPFESLELALVEAWVAGGNYVLALEPKYRQALLQGDEKALTAWRSLGRSARWLRERTDLFRQPALPIVTVLVDPGEVSAEIANLMFRQSVSPSIAPASNPPAVDPAKCPVLVAAGLDAPKPDVAARILAHAKAGAIVVVDDTSEKAWWRTAGLALAKKQDDRDFYTLGKGQVVAYQQVGDPSEFALDVIDFVTQDKRPTRLWNAQGGIPRATLAPTSGPVNGRALLHVVNYSRPVDLPVLARIQGNFTSATVLRPDADPVDVKVAKRGTNSEVSIPSVQRLAVVVFR